MNYFKAAEQILSSVPALEQATENLKRRQQRLIEGGAPREAGAINYNKPFTDTHYVSDTLSELLEISECSRNIAKNEAELSFIREIVDQLQDEHKQLIRLWYFQKLPKEAVMEQMYIESLSTVYSLRNKAVAEFALLYFGAAALPSI